MAGKCPQCGVEMPAAESRACDVCGYVRYGRILLKAVATGKEARFGIDTTVDRLILRTLSPEDSRFASSPQFRLVRDSALKAWALEALTSAVNKTCVNGTEVGVDRVPLRAGDVISVGPDRMRLEVVLID